MDGSGTWLTQQTAVSDPHQDSGPVQKKKRYASKNNKTDKKVTLQQMAKVARSYVDKEIDEQWIVGFIDPERPWLGNRYMCYECASLIAESGSGTTKIKRQVTVHFSEHGDIETANVVPICLGCYHIKTRLTPQDEVVSIRITIVNK